MHVWTEQCGRRMEISVRATSRYGGQYCLRPRLLCGPHNVLHLQGCYVRRFQCTFTLGPTILLRRLISFYQWNSGWPVELTTDFAKTLLDGVTSTLKTLLSLGGVQSKLTEFIGSTETDEKHLEGLSNLSSGLAARDGDSPVYMASVSPWFFTHYGPDSFNKNVSTFKIRSSNWLTVLFSQFVFLGDQHLYARRWESLIASRDKFDIVEINTWNDYGESHYIGPIKGAQPNSEAWTDGMNHTGWSILLYSFITVLTLGKAWLGLTKYYATAFKTDSFPEIEKDQIYMWSRPHSTIAEAQDDPVGRPTNFELVREFCNNVGTMFLMPVSSLRMQFGLWFSPLRPPVLH